ncbi:fetuin-B [Rousettus aegyptiacus]|uniref:Fetuin B n=1 Tax=Rousettus aegyptiacus TaxID=9407 RepID=A0A7J8HQG3_ROUAE|nr:fetuin-B [Rousettus aegyptiacus]KAF6474129.1 fetuin B [Rousettus aegyptiacus]
MDLLLLLVLCSLATFYTVESLLRQALRLSPLLSRGCNDSDVLAVAGIALQDVNSDRKDGYVLSLNRVSDVREHRQDDLGSVFYLTLDVLETDCHVLSKKAWRDCEARSFHQSVYGQCKAIFYINEPRRVLYLPAYNCTLRPVSQRKVHRMCPDCPSPDDLSDPRVLEAVTESLAKYNNENTSKQYALFKVTKASSQWVFGLACFVEYLIKESPCTKSEASSCALQLTDSVPVGLCKGSLSHRNSEKFVSVTCDFFESQAPTPGDENSADNQRPANLSNVEEPQQKNTAPTDSPFKAAPKGSVQYLLDLNDEKPKGSQGKGPVEAFSVQLDLTTNPQGETLDVSFLSLGPMKEKLVVLPFPKKENRSAKCPGPAERANPLILPP